MQRQLQTENFYKSLHMLQANSFLRENDSTSPFEDYSIYVYRQSAPIFKDRVEELERKIRYPVRFVEKSGELFFFVVVFVVFIN